MMSDEQPPREYERRFLVVDSSVLDGHVPDVLAQAFLFVKDGWIVRVRRVFRRSQEAGTIEEGPLQLAIKGPREDAARIELEWEIPLTVAIELFRKAELKVFKSRYQLVDARTTWDIDVFHMRNEGLIIAECETNDRESLQRIVPPRWCGEEISNDPRYNNEELAQHPFMEW